MPQDKDVRIDHNAFDNMNSKISHSHKLLGELYPHNYLKHLKS